MKTIFIVSTILFQFSINLLFGQSRDTWQQPEKVMDKIGVKPGMVIGEAGAGHGYFTFKLAERVETEGKIYANDISQTALDAINLSSIKNIHTV